MRGRQRPRDERAVAEQQLEGEIGEEQRQRQVERGAAPDEAALGQLSRRPRGGAGADEQAADRQRPRAPGAGGDGRPDQQRVNERSMENCSG
jgi:hypothetical protein